MVGRHHGDLDAELSAEAARQAPVKLALAQGLLINVTADKTVRLLPPLILSDDEADQVIERVARLISDFTANAA